MNSGDRQIRKETTVTVSRVPMSRLEQSIVDIESESEEYIIAKDEETTITLSRGPMSKLEQSIVDIDNESEEYNMTKGDDQGVWRESSAAGRSGEIFVLYCICNGIIMTQIATEDQYLVWTKAEWLHLSCVHSE